MRTRKPLIISRRLIAIWAVLSIAFLAVGFLATAYPFFIVAGLAFSSAAANTSERRWRWLIGLLTGKEISSSEAAGRWRPANSTLLVAHGLVWLMLGIVVLLFANVRLVKLLL